MPPQPEQLPHMPSYPAFQPEYRPPVLSQLIIPPPASNKAVPTIPQLIAGHAPATSPQLPHLRPESFDAFRRYSNPQFAVQPKAQELTFPDPPCTALAGIH